MIGIARKNLAQAEGWLHGPDEVVPDVLGQQLLDRLRRNQIAAWCRKASTSPGSAARERAAVRRVRRGGRSTDITPGGASIVETSTAATRTGLSVGTTV